MRHPAIIYKAKEDLSHNHNYAACVAMLKDCGVVIEERIEPIGVVTRSMGKANPKEGFVILTPLDGPEPSETLLNYRDVFNWLARHGLFPL